MTGIAVAALPFATVVRVEPWNAPAGRWFAAWQARDGYRWFLGQGVIDEFATLSSPVFVAPAPLLGKIYDAGISLGIARDPELPLDAGWPPVCLGVEAPAPPLPGGWEETLLAAVRGEQPAVASEAPASPEALRPRRAAVRAVGRTVEAIRIGEVTVLVTDAPLLPHQLGRLAEPVPGSFVLAIATGNRVVAGEGSPQEVAVASEEELEALRGAVGGRF